MGLGFPSSRKVGRTVNPLQEVINCVWGGPPETGTYPIDEIDAAKAILRQPDMSVERVSKIMAWVTADPFWSPVVQSVCKLEFHLAAILEKIAKDPHADVTRPYDAPKPEPEPEEVQFKEERALSRDEKIAEVQRPWLELIAEAQARGLRGIEIPRWVSAERGRRMKGKLLANGRIGDGAPAFAADLIFAAERKLKSAAPLITAPAPAAPVTDQVIRLDEPRGMDDEGDRE